MSLWLNSLRILIQLLLLHVGLLIPLHSPKMENYTHGGIIYIYIYIYSDGTYGGLGRGRRVSEYIPMHVSVSKHGSERECKMIAAGSLHSMCLTKQNEIFTWGTGSGGRLGLNHAEDSLQPQEIESLNDQCPLFIAAGESHSAAISNYYQLWTWGMGSFGRLGHGLDCNELMPKLVEDLVDEKIIYVSCGVFHTLVLTKNGSLYGFGEDKYGKLATKVDDEGRIYILVGIFGIYIDIYYYIYWYIYIYITISTH